MSSPLYNKSSHFSILLRKKHSMWKIQIPHSFIHYYWKEFRISPLVIQTLWRLNIYMNCKLPPTFQCNSHWDNGKQKRLLATKCTNRAEMVFCPKFAPPTIRDHQRCQKPRSCNFHQLFCCTSLLEEQLAGSVYLVFSKYYTQISWSWRMGWPLIMVFTMPTMMMTLIDV